MSIDEHLNPDDGTHLTRLDNMLVKAAGMVGSLYERHTHKSYKTLVRGCYAVAEFGLGIASIRPDSFGQACYAHLKRKDQRDLTLKEETMCSELLDIPPALSRIWRSGLLLFTLVNAYGSYKCSSSDKELHMWLGVAGLIQTIGLVPMVFAEYLNRAYVRNPNP